jgi:hypothetical protein
VASALLRDLKHFGVVLGETRKVKTLGDALAAIEEFAPHIVYIATDHALAERCLEHYALVERDFAIVCIAPHNLAPSERQSVVQVIIRGGADGFFELGTGSDVMLRQSLHFTREQLQLRLLAAMHDRPHNISATTTATTQHQTPPLRTVEPPPRNIASWEAVLRIHKQDNYHMFVVLASALSEQQQAEAVSTASAARNAASAARTMKLHVHKNAYSKDELPDFFLSIHKSHIINVRCIRSFNKKALMLTDGSAVPIARRSWGILEGYVRALSPTYRELSAFIEALEARAAAMEKRCSVYELNRVFF